MPAVPRPIRFHGVDFATENVPCDFCGGDSFRELSLGSRHGVALRTVVCACGLCQTMPRMNAESSAKFYREFYHLFHGRSGVDAAYLAKSRAQAERRVAALSAHVPERAAVLEIGSGAGQFLAVASERTQWQARGIEPGRESAEACARQRLNVVEATVDTAEFATASFDAVVSFHVLEHLPSPARLFERAAQWLKPGGLLWLEVPNLSRPGCGLEEFFQLPHLYSFTPLTLRNYFRKFGFETRYLSDRPGAFTLAGVAAGRTEQVDTIDVEAELAHYRNVNRVQALARLLPRFSILGKIRSTLEAV
jgi:SAM-dependent methyltransferase